MKGTARTVGGSTMRSSSSALSHHPTKSTITNTIAPAPATTWRPDHQAHPAPARRQHPQHHHAAHLSAPRHPAAPVCWRCQSWRHSHLRSTDFAKCNYSAPTPNSAPSRPQPPLRPSALPGSLQAAEYYHQIVRFTSPFYLI